MQINQCIYVIAHSIHVARLCLRGNRNDLITHGLSNLLVVEPATSLQVSHRGHEPKINPAQGIANLYNPCCVWGSLGCGTDAPRLRGNRDDLIAHGLSNLLVVEPATVLRVSIRGRQPKIKPAQGRFDFWLGRTDSNHDKENQNLLSYH